MKIKNLMFLLLALLILLCSCNKIPVEKPTPLFKQICITGSSTYGIKEDGSLWIWGFDTESQKEPQKIVDDVLYVYSGPIRRKYSLTYYVYVIKTDYTLWLYRGTLESEKIMDDVKFVSRGSGYTMAIKTDNTLWAWGANSGYQLTDKIDVYRGTDTPTQIMEDVIFVSASDWHTMVIKSDNTLWGGGVPMMVG